MQASRRAACSGFNGTEWPHVGRTPWEGTAVRKMEGVGEGGEVIPHIRPRHATPKVPRKSTLTFAEWGRKSRQRMRKEQSCKRPHQYNQRHHRPISCKIRSRSFRPCHWPHRNIPLNPEDCRPRNTKDASTQADVIAFPQSLLTTDESPERPTSPPPPARSERSCLLP